MIALALVLIALVALYIYNVRTFDYWEKRGVKHDKPVLFFGNNAENFLLRKSVAQKAVEMYRKYPKERIVGFFRSTSPELVIRDPEIVNRILISDFNHFYKRGVVDNKEPMESITRNLAYADGDLWKLLRQRIAPAFSIGKVKAMFPLIIERAERLQERVVAATGARAVFDARELMARYTTDVIGACAFGIDANSLNQDESPIRELGAAIFNFDAKRFIFTALKDGMPRLFSHLKPRARIQQGVEELVEAILRKINYEPSGRNDFIDNLIKMKKKGLITAESIEHMKPDGTPENASLEMNEELMIAQVFIFFAAGFETSSSATSYTLHQLAYYPEVQKKVREEIDRVLANHKYKLSYDAVKEMRYLDWTFKESLRMFPSLGFLPRKCVRKYTIPETDVTIDDGVRVLIPVQALHMDPKYFEDPEHFKPDRFSPDSFNSTQKAVYLPFGSGPRTCIAERLGLMQSLTGLAAILSRFTVAPAPESVRWPRIDPKSNFVQAFRGGLPLLFKLRK